MHNTLSLCLCCLADTSVCILRCHIGRLKFMIKNTRLKNYDLVLLFVVLYSFVCLLVKKLIFSFADDNLLNSIAVNQHLRHLIFSMGFRYFFAIARSFERSLFDQQPNKTKQSDTCKCQVCVPYLKIYTKK